MLSEREHELVMHLAKKMHVKDIGPPVDCEVCGHPMPTHADAMNVMCVFQVGVPGHPAIPAFQCPMIEHWTCSIECFRAAAVRCLDEHIIPMMNNAHERVGRQKPIARSKDG